MGCKMKKSIAWIKWHNPYGDDDGIMKSFKNNLLEELKNLQEENDEAGLEYAEATENRKPHLPIQMMMEPSEEQIKVISTPMGMVPLTEHTDPNQIFNFWVGHTNFDISKDIVDVINHVSGVETLDIYTRYRFRVGIGKHPDFVKDRDVLNNITTAVQET